MELMKSSNITKDSIITDLHQHDIKRIDQLATELKKILTESKIEHYDILTYYVNEELLINNESATRNLHNNLYLKKIHEGIFSAGSINESKQIPSDNIITYDKILTNKIRDICFELYQLTSTNKSISKTDLHIHLVDEDTIPYYLLAFGPCFNNDIYDNAYACDNETGVLSYISPEQFIDKCKNVKKFKTSIEFL